MHLYSYSYSKLKCAKYLYDVKNLCVCSPMTTLALTDWDAAQSESREDHHLSEQNLSAVAILDAKLPMMFHPVKWTSHCQQLTPSAGF